jgi:Spy/CpxP family protein refolding chaperone
MASHLSATALPQPAEKVAILSLVLVFICGAVFGVVVMSLTGHLRPAHAAAAAPADGLSMSVSEWKQGLDLSAEQTLQLTSILDDFARYYDNVLADGNSRIMQILNPEQRRKFEQMLRDRKQR